MSPFKVLPMILSIGVVVGLLELEPIALAEDTDGFSVGGEESVSIEKKKKKRKKRRKKRRKRLTDRDSYLSDDSSEEDSGPLAAFKKLAFRVGGVYMKYSPDSVNGAINDINNNAILNLDSKVPEFSSTYAVEGYAGYKLFAQLDIGPFFNIMGDEVVSGSNENTKLSVEESIKFMAFGVKAYYFFYAKESFGLFLSPALGLSHFSFKDTVIAGTVAREVEASAWGSYYRLTFGGTYLLFPSLGSYFELGFQNAKSGDMIVDSVSQTNQFKVGDGITFKDGDGTIDLSGLYLSLGITFQL